MSIKIQYVGVDVDDNAFHGYSIVSDREEGKEFVTRPSASELIKKLTRISEEGYELKICYEATYLGYSLQRDLSSKGFNCEVIAPSLIPRSPGHKVKTDRIDAKKLTLFYKKGLLTPVHIPNKDEEILRDLLRSRRFLLGQIKRLKTHVLSNCRRLGLHYRNDVGKPKAAYWTTLHSNWMIKKMNESDKSLSKTNLSLLRSQRECLEEQMNLYDKEIEAIGKSDSYKRKVSFLSCYRGLDTLSAMTLILEISDIGRFDHPKRLTSYVGMDLIEYSSGGHERRFKISKMGNKYIRTCVVEACQGVFHKPQISRALKLRRELSSPEAIGVANRCMRRLHKKAMHLLYEGKTKNKIKVACARELLSFIWESLKLEAGSMNPKINLRLAGV